MAHKPSSHLGLRIFGSPEVLRATIRGVHVKFFGQDAEKCLSIEVLMRDALKVARGITEMERQSSMRDLWAVLTRLRLEGPFRVGVHA